MNPLPSPPSPSPARPTRRMFLRNAVRLAALTGLGGLAGWLGGRASAKGYV